MTKTQVLVIGSGPGGYTAAFRAADLGKQVTLIERYDYRGPFIMQAYRDVDGISIFKEQLYWINQYLGGLNCQ